MAYFRRNDGVCGGKSLEFVTLANRSVKHVETFKMCTILRKTPIWRIQPFIESSIVGLQLKQKLTMKLVKQEQIHVDESSLLM